MNILNLYAGVGGNRKLWEEHEVVAVELDPSIAKIYQDFFPNDKVVVEDAHEYLRRHYQEFDFIWSSPPCPSHSRINNCYGDRRLRKFPDMKLYEEIIFLQHWFKGRWVIENVISYYKPLIEPQIIQKHFFWSNFKIEDYKGKRISVCNAVGQTTKIKMKAKNVLVENWHNYKGDKRAVINNMIEEELGKHILNSSKQSTKIWKKEN